MDTATCSWERVKDEGAGSLIALARPRKQVMDGCYEMVVSHLVDAEQRVIAFSSIGLYFSLSFFRQSPVQ